MAGQAWREIPATLLLLLLEGREPELCIGIVAKLPPSFHELGALFAFAAFLPALAASTALELEISLPHTLHHLMRRRVSMQRKRQPLLEQGKVKMRKKLRVRPSAPSRVRAWRQNVR